MDLEYDIQSTYLHINLKKKVFNINVNLFLDARDWSYQLRSKVHSPFVFHYLVKDDQNLLEFNSYIKFRDYSLDASHTLQIYSSEDLTDSYELKWFTNSEKTGSVFYIILNVGT